MNDIDRDGKPDPARLVDLLADRAVFGLDDGEEQELSGLLRDHPPLDADAFDRLASAVALATGRLEAAEALPAALRSRLLEDATRVRAGGPSGRQPVSRRLIALGVAALATAAGLVVMLARPDGETPRAPNGPGRANRDGARFVATPAAQREELLAAVQDAVQLECAAADGDESRAVGDVVWSPSRQRGFLRVRGLARNEPGRSQYQIWVVDRGHRQPLAGGVFDVPSADGDVVVPILPRGLVHEPTMFAITVEEPGGADDYRADRARVVARAD